MRKRVLFIVVVIVIVVAGVAVLRSLRKEAPEGVLELSGNVEVTETNVGFKVPGKIAAVFMDEGQRVEEGERLAQLIATDMAEVVVGNRAAVGSASARLRELQKGSRPQEIEQASSSVKAAEAELARTKNDYDRAELLYQQGAIAKNRYDSAKSAYETSQAQHRGASEYLSVVKEGPRKETVEAADYDLARARAALAVSQAQIQDTILLAPVSGVILRKNAEPGEVLPAGSPVFTIGDLTRPWIKVYVKEDKLGLVKLGQRAEIAVDSRPGKTYAGTVTYISSEAEFTPKNVQTKEERIKLVFAVKVSAQNLDGVLMPGIPADVRIFTQ